MGLQLEPNDKGLGVLGVVEADFLTPTHNKQDFDDTPTYRLPSYFFLTAALTALLNISPYDLSELNATLQPFCALAWLQPVVATPRPREQVCSLCTWHCCHSQACVVWWQ